VVRSSCEEIGERKCPLSVTGCGLLLHLGVERIDYMCDSRRLEHHLRPITLGFVCEFRTQFIDVDVL